MNRLLRSLPLTAIVVILLWLSHCGAVTAEDGNKASTGTFSILFENDLFGGTDRNYTNGVKLSWVSRDLTRYRDSKRLPRWMLPVVKRLPFINRRGLQRNVGLGLGQNIFTPRDLQRSDLIKDDRPYAGWLYLSAAFHNKNQRRLDTMEIQAGVVGPAALGKEAQNTVHRLRHINQAQGWSNQLHDELGIAFIYEHKHRFLKRFTNARYGADLITHYGGALGSVYTYLNSGLETRLGWNLPADFGTSLIRPGGEANAPVDSNDPLLSTKRRTGIYGFAALSGRLVIHDIFLDGNNFEDSHHVNKKPWVGDLIWGIGVTRKGWKFTYSQVIRTREFHRQPHHHNFGSFSVSWTL